MKQEKGHLHPQTGEKLDNTQVEIMQEVQIMDTLYVDDLTETWFSEWHSEIEDVIVQSGLNWTLEEKKGTEELQWMELKPGR